MNLSVTSSLEGATRLVNVAGEVDVSNAGDLRAALDEALATKAASVKVELGKVSYIDSTGIGVLVGAAHRASDQGIKFAIANPQRNVARVLSLLGVDGELNVEANE